MSSPSENKPKKHICVGLLAHVDAGKTTLAESILYKSGAIRKLGRVDHKDAFLDTHGIERERGITIFSKQAVFTLPKSGQEIFLLDTPGHVDFSAEMERTLQVLDYAVLVISGADGVQGHVRTLWKLLKHYQIPVFLFINKMDQEGILPERLLEELQQNLSRQCLSFGDFEEDFMENLAMCEENLMDSYLKNGKLTEAEIARQIKNRNIFPCYFGSALKIEGIEELLEGIRKYTIPMEYPKEFGAHIYKIGRDVKGQRLTYLKVTGGTLRVKMPIGDEKVEQIRIYSGENFETVAEAEAGTVCAVTGLSTTHSGQGLGIQNTVKSPILEPVLTYRILLPKDCDAYEMLAKLRLLEEEDPLLHILWEERLQEIHAQVMGEVQIEVLKTLIYEKFGLSVEFDSGNIVYKETIENTAEGVGHFEPLRHYAEVHLRLEPGEANSGLQFATDCSEDKLDRNWQRLILTHLKEKPHKGVLTGAEITDMKITLVAGRAHLKHSEGGDFRQATYRAVRHGLKRAKSVLLEPVYEFALEVPTECIGRAMSDVQKMHGKFQAPQTKGKQSILKGSAPVATMQHYASQVHAYTSGQGKLFCCLKGYEKCHNAEQIIEECAYDSEQDLENPTGSVFCAHGSGFAVPWHQVEDYMHVEAAVVSDTMLVQAQEIEQHQTRPTDSIATEKELEAIFERTYGPVKKEGKERNPYKKRKNTLEISYSPRKNQKIEPKEKYLLVDGYNIIFAWPQLKELAKDNLESARGRLLDILCNYQGYKKQQVIVVFDAYKVKGNPGEVQRYHNIYVIYTKEAETADQYIEKAVRDLTKKYQVTVATSDALEQIIIFGQGAMRLSAWGLKEEVEAVEQEIRNRIQEKENE